MVSATGCCQALKVDAGEKAFGMAIPEAFLANFAASTAPFFFLSQHGR
jgi:hypothetical protein